MCIRDRFQRVQVFNQPFIIELRNDHAGGMVPGQRGIDFPVYADDAEGLGKGGALQGAHFIPGVLF